MFNIRSNTHCQEIVRALQTAASPAASFDQAIDDACLSNPEVPKCPIPL